MSEPILGGFVVSRPQPIAVKTGSVVYLDFESDWHIGAAYVDYKMLTKTVERVCRDKARLNINGDVFDLILPSDKKRYSPDALHPRISGRADVVGESVRWAAEILTPAAKLGLIDMIGCGNHETATSKWCGFDPTMALIYELEKVKPKGHIIHHGGITGFIDYRFKRDKKKEEVSDVVRGLGRYIVYYHHDIGGGSPVTKGTIDFARVETFIDADLYWLAHKHTNTSAKERKMYCPIRGDDVLCKPIRHIRTGAYGDIYTGQSQESIRKNGRRTTYAAEKRMAPHDKGGARLVFEFDSLEEPTIRLIT